MNSFSIVTLTVLLLAVSSAHENSIEKRMMRPSQWLSPLQLEQAPSVEEISFEKLENMSMEKGVEMLEKMYHLSQINHSLRPDYVPSPNTTPVHIYKSSGQKITTTLDKMAAAASQLHDLEDEKITIFITGMPSTIEAVRKTNDKLIEAYLQRYSAKTQELEKHNRSDEKMMRTSSEEDSREWQRREPSKGLLLVIDLGAKLNNFNRWAMLDIKQTGAMIASAVMEMMDKENVADENLHIVAQGMAAHVAGAFGHEYLRRTGRKLRRITALDPSKIYAKDPYSLNGLSRGDAEFIDAIHTNVYGLGTLHRVGDVDFYPNGPSASVPGAKNVVEASMRATFYYADTVQPGHERNFPAVAAYSLKEYLDNDGFSRRVYMGIDTDIDVEGDYILEVNDRTPYAKRIPARRHNYQRMVFKPRKTHLNDE